MYQGGDCLDQEKRGSLISCPSSFPWRSWPSFSVPFPPPPALMLLYPIAPSPPSPPLIYRRLSSKASLAQSLPVTAARILCDLSRRSSPSMAQEGRGREQEETGCQQSAGPGLCANNCGCFSGEATLNFCTKCYREVVLRKATAFSSAVVSDVPMVSPFSEERHSSSREEEIGMNLLQSDPQHEPARAASALEIASASPSIAAREQEHRSIKVPNRCSHCFKRIGLTGFKCRCGDLFCALHRYSDMHNCPFDYKAAARHAIAKANPVIKADKVQRI